jgi:hypothetical protein
MYDLCKAGTPDGQVTSCCSELAPELWLDFEQRRIRGWKMEPLLAGEFALLAYLGRRPGNWHPTVRLAANVYGRSDPGGRELVWKYASTLRRKLGTAAPDLIQVCRRRGYCCRHLIGPRGTTHERVEPALVVRGPEARYERRTHA